MKRKLVTVCGQEYFQKRVDEYTKCGWHMIPESLRVWSSGGGFWEPVYNHFAVIMETDDKNDKEPKL